jgi:heavy metal translocating P-type ATPase
MTGEPIPISAGQGDSIVSGSANVGNSFEMRAERTSAESMYSGIVSLVEDAVARKAPMVRMADRYSVVFLGVTLSLAAGSWIVTGDPIRALAVLVVATPCPLILAPPVALVAGTSRAARRGIIVKGSAAIERLGRAGAVLIDKTGTITHGTPTISRIAPVSSFTEDELLRLAGSVEQMSVHSVAEEIAHAAAQRGAVPVASDVVETPGHGVSGNVEGVRVSVGSASYVASTGVTVPDINTDGQAVAGAYVAVDGQYAGRIELSDVVRPDADELITRLHALGITQITMATGDAEAAARRVSAQVGISDVVAECTPQMKLDVLDRLRSAAGGGAVVMVGDGVNDAPALAAADVGIAMGSAGATAASESAEAIILADRVSLVADAVEIGRRSRSIALQSVIVGMGLSMVGMGFAAAGLLPPVYGALTQEAIDLAVILNALRALREPSSK